MSFYKQERLPKEIQETCMYMRKRVQRHGEDLKGLKRSNEIRRFYLNGGWNRS
ncbi:MAG TPA: hypothetical protein VEY51_08390 [Chondromyces sp.]|nr:hypothetical protein [Chondromyces sp.]